MKRSIYHPGPPPAYKFSLAVPNHVVLGNIHSKNSSNSPENSWVCLCNQRDNEMQHVFFKVYFIIINKIRRIIDFSNCNNEPEK